MADTDNRTTDNGGEDLVINSGYQAGVEIIKGGFQPQASTQQVGQNPPSGPSAVPGAPSSPQSPAGSTGGESGQSSGNSGGE